MAENIVQKVIQLLIYLISLYFVGKFFKKFNSQLIGEIIVGMILGPQLLNILPYNDAFALIGEIGLITMVCEGGLGVKLEELNNIGIRAILLAFFGTIFPIVSGYLFMVYGLQLPWLEGLNSGTLLSNTSIGVTMSLLNQTGEIKSITGKLIMVAAMVDDVVSLVILATLTQISKNQKDVNNEFNIWLTLKPIIVSAFFLLLSLSIKSKIIPWLKQILEPKFKNFDKKNINQIKLFMLIGFVLFLSFVLGILIYNQVFSDQLGSTHLLGAFIAGMCFSELSDMESILNEFSFVKQGLISIFFGSLGFVIPVRQMFELNYIFLGILYTIPAVLGKLLCGIFAHNWKSDFWTIGWAMVGRGELGFVMGKTALEQKNMTNYSFIICVWALIISTFISPFMFKYCLNQKAIKIQNIQDKKYDGIQTHVSEDQINPEDNVTQKVFIKG